MTTKIKTTLLTVFFLFGLLTGLQAQDKYEFATVRQVGISEIITSTEEKPFESEKLPKGFIHSADNSYLFARVAKLQQDGWEVFTTHENYSGGLILTTIFLRKRKN